jgi:ferredoxin
MGKFKIEHNRPECIGCGACAAVCPDFWFMDEKDGKSHLKGATDTKKDNEIVLEVLELSDLKCNKDAAESCPVNIIHITDMEKGEKLI